MLSGISKVRQRGSGVLMFLLSGSKPPIGTPDTMLEGNFKVILSSRNWFPSLLVCVFVAETSTSWEPLIIGGQCDPQTPGSLHLMTKGIPNSTCPKPKYWNQTSLGYLCTLLIAQALGKLFQISEPSFPQLRVQRF